MGVATAGAGLAANLPGGCEGGLGQQGRGRQEEGGQQGEEGRLYREEQGAGGEPGEQEGGEGGGGRVLRAPAPSWTTAL